MSESLSLLCVICRFSPFLGSVDRGPKAAGAVTMKCIRDFRAVPLNGYCAAYTDTSGSRAPRLTRISLRFSLIVHGE